MVRRLAAASDSTAPGSALLGQAVSATPLQSVPSRRPRAEASCVETLKRHYRKSGFSGRAARVLLGVLRESSSRLYQLRWKIFCVWCRGRGVAPVNAAVPVVVDFLIHLRQDKGLSVSAVKGYCSALNSVLALKGRDLAAAREITTCFVVSRDRSILLSYVLLRGTFLLYFRALRGLRMSLCGRVRSVFWPRKRSSYWPLPRLSVSVSSTLCRIESLIPGTGVRFPLLLSLVLWPRLRIPLPLLLGLRAFQYRPYQMRERIAMGDCCPVRAVKVYLDPTASHRPRCERLFVTAGRSKKEIAKTTVSFWLRKTISRAYELSGTALPVPDPRARETRGIAPSILFRKNFAVDQVLKAGTWRRHTTFTRHYLRDIAHKSLDTFHLGPVVAAQSVV